MDFYRYKKINCWLRGVVLVFLMSGFSVININAGDHPKGLFGKDKLSEIRSKIGREPFVSMYKHVIYEEEEQSEKIGGVKDRSELLKKHAFLFAMDGDTTWSRNAYEQIRAVASDSLFVNAPYSFGLTRSSILRSLAYAYDFCFNAWNHTQREFVWNVTFELMQSVNASMGPQANYRLESNWMGVRYGSAMLAAVVLNDSLALEKGRSIDLTSHIWDIKERLRDHIDASHTERGWFVESMGYHGYDASFVWPAIIAFQNFTGEHILSLQEYAPKVLSSLDQHFTGTVSIPAKDRLGIKPDLSDDNVAAGFVQWPLGLRIMPDNQKPFIRWMHSYLLDMDKPELLPGEDIFYSVVFYDDEKEKINPRKGGYLNYVDTTQGVAIFRNTFKDSTDIVAAFNASAHRKHGHAGPDNLTFRITGLGNLWAIGGGRTSESRGQTNLFPAMGTVELSGPLSEGHWLDHNFSENGSGYAIASGSCVGVKNHKRFFSADFSSENDARALFVVSDVSDNGEIWRLHTPGFNRVEVLDDGILINAPNKSSMKIHLPRIHEPDIEIGTVRYGGLTERHNPGVIFHQNAFFNNHIIDVRCNGNLLVVMTLAGEGEPHPQIGFDEETSRVVADETNIEVPFHGGQTRK